MVPSDITRRRARIRIPISRCPVSPFIAPVAVGRFDPGQCAFRRAVLGVRHRGPGMSDVNALRLATRIAVWDSCEVQLADKGFSNGGIVRFYNHNYWQPWRSHSETAGLTF